MARPDPIEYAERLYAAIRGAHFSPISFLAFGTAVKDGVPMRSMPRIAAEPFMRVVGEMLDLEESAADEGLPLADALLVEAPTVTASVEHGLTEARPTDSRGGNPPAEGPVSTERNVEGTPSQPKIRNRTRRD